MRQAENVCQIWLERARKAGGRALSSVFVLLSRPGTCAFTVSGLARTGPSIFVQAASAGYCGLVCTCEFAITHSFVSHAVVGAATMSFERRGRHGQSRFASTFAQILHWHVEIARSPHQIPCGSFPDYDRQNWLGPIRQRVTELDRWWVPLLVVKLGVNSVARAR